MGFVDKNKRGFLKKEFKRLFYFTDLKRGTEGKSFDVSDFTIICSALNNPYTRSTISPSQFIELLELYIEFFKEKTDITGDRV